MLLKLAVKNVVSRKSSFVIIAFVAFAVALLVLTNSIFDSSEQGIENLFVSGFTGDFMVRPLSERPCSLFGDETPVIGELTALEMLAPFREIADVLENSSELAAFSPQLSGSAFIENQARGVRFSVFLFAVNPDTYLDVMGGIQIVAGQPVLEKGNVMLNAVMAERLGANVGDELQFVIADGSTFRIRVARVSAVYSYADESQVLDRICLLDVETFSSLMALSTLSALEAGGSAGTPAVSGDAAGGSADAGEPPGGFDGGGDFSLDELFFGTEDVSLETEGGEGVAAASDLEALFFSSEEAALEEEIPLSAGENTSWHFITGRLRDGQTPAFFIHRLNKIFRANGWPVEAVNWRNAGGAFALYLYWLRVIFNTGILVVLAAGFIVVNNTLIINVLSRSKEIGTMRAIGASGFFISRLFMTETFILAASAGIIGSVLGWLAGLLLTSAEISFSNQMLSQLFGGESLSALVSRKNLFDVCVLVVILSVLAWIYPVRTALSTSPTVSMQGEKG